MAQRSPSDYRIAIRKVQRLYSTPGILSRAIDLVRRSDVNLEQLDELIRQDPALTADIIRLSNSALFSRGGGCADLNLALQRLGLRELIRAIELSLSKHLFGKGLSNYGISADRYWRGSVLAALLMEQLAVIHGVDAPEAHIVGILHALGRVLIQEVLNQSGGQTVWDRSCSLEKWEVSRVGFTHAEAGALLLREWGFPAAIVAPIENQLGAPTLAKAQSPTGMLRFVRLLLTRDPEAATTPQPAELPADLLGWAGFATQGEIDELLGEVRTSLERIDASLRDT
jgi:HD-like signal output (HDOD) protein